MLAVRVTSLTDFRCFRNEPYIYPAMAYDLYLQERIDKQFKEKQVDFHSKKMMGGLCYMVDDKMCVGIIKNELMVRVGPDAYETLLEKEFAREMDFNKRPMRGYIYVSPEGIDFEDDLEFWLDRALAFNPLAKSSKKK